MMLIIRHITSTRRLTPRKSLRIPRVLPVMYSRFDIGLVYRTSLVSSFLSLFRKSEARNITISDWAIFIMYRLIRGSVEGIASVCHASFPTGLNMPIFMIVRIKRAPMENNLKSQLRRRVFASYRATVLMLCKEIIDLDF